MRHVFTLLLIPENAALEDLIEALKLGVDDFLAKPIVFGELLARLRAAARGLEYERRVQAYFGTDALLGLPNENTFRQAVTAALAKPDRTGSVACVALDLDFFNRLNYMYGRPEADDTLRSVARLLSKSCRTNDLPSSSGDDGFRVLLANHTEAEAGEWAEQFRATLAESQFPLGTASEALTASFGVAAAAPGTMGADGLLKRATDALHAAKRAGRNCVILRSSLDDESNAWTNLGSPGKLFDRTVARDVMIPTPLTLQTDDTLVHAATLFERTGQIAAAVVDDEGRLTGLLLADQLTTGTSNSQAVELVRDIMHEDPVSFAEDVTFGELVSFFTHDSHPLAVIVDDGRPSGVVTREGLAQLSEPLTSQTFASHDTDATTSDYLVVPMSSVK